MHRQFYGVVPIYHFRQKDSFINSLALYVSSCRSKTALLGYLVSLRNLTSCLHLLAAALPFGFVLLNRNLSRFAPYVFEVCARVAYAYFALAITKMFVKSMCVPFDLKLSEAYRNVNFLPNTHFGRSATLPILARFREVSRPSFMPSGPKVWALEGQSLYVYTGRQETRTHRQSFYYI